MRKRKYEHSANENFTPDSLKENIDSVWQREYPEEYTRVTGKKPRVETDDDIPKAEIHNLVGTALLKSDILPLNLHLVAALVNYSRLLGLISIIV